MSRPLSERDAGAVLAGAATVGAESGASEGPVEAAAVLSPYIPIATESSHSYESCALSTTKELKTSIRRAALLANCIYESADLANAPEGYIGGSRELVKSEHLLSPWATTIAYPNSEGSQDIFVVFRGSEDGVDWLLNFSVMGREHSCCNDVLVHSGYEAELGDARSRNSLYSELVSRLDKMVKRDRTRRVIACGHSKGGGLAQLFIDALFYDDSCHLAAPHGGDTVEYKLGLLRAITFGAPMVFASSSHDKIKKMRSQELFHNFIITGDPVPVIQPLLLYNWSAFVNMGAIGVGVSLLRGREHVNALEAVLQLYRPVGSIYVATESRTDKFIRFVFERIESCVYEDLSKWNCVTAFKFRESLHYRTLYKTILCKTGVFVENDTKHDIEVCVAAAEGALLPSWGTETRVTIGAGEKQYIHTCHDKVAVSAEHCHSEPFAQVANYFVSLVTLGFIVGSGLKTVANVAADENKLVRVRDANGLSISVYNACDEDEE
jgi:hypothetical protein